MMVWCVCKYPAVVYGAEELIKVRLHNTSLLHTLHTYDCIHQKHALIHKLKCWSAYIHMMHTLLYTSHGKTND